MRKRLGDKFIYATRIPSITAELTTRRDGVNFPHRVLGGISPADLLVEASAPAGKLLEHHQSPK
ncbi:hypothetical protein A2647_02510 [Candidatus Nomurabacteria bacterium RIFCSPHIGHO2_01_FULL_40_24b]|uniref:Uncharacterized protein n=1 Tax=Candidatus Nomurabacteria bacterium RIFCSPHIGHO2_01_FULL_40_24b TaxID=1801739 RepID=A0A1F6V8Q2_9BACT|nr:MAG: hypothetical protein A2647_02510 [Candidatus Nomurabacteria bacterium RIFCSPHIGHO2_01_FULL_40_24b]